MLDLAEQRAEDELVSLRRACGCLRICLTERETAVLEQLAAGKPTMAAAKSLFVSQQAITYHVGNLLAKFQCANRSGLIARAFVLGVLECTWPPRISVSSTSARPVEMCRHGVKEFHSDRTLREG